MTCRRGSFYRIFVRSYYIYIYLANIYNVYYGFFIRHIFIFLFWIFSTHNGILPLATLGTTDYDRKKKCIYIFFTTVSESTDFHTSLSYDPLTYTRNKHAPPPDRSYHFPKSLSHLFRFSSESYFLLYHVTFFSSSGTFCDFSQSLSKLKSATLVSTSVYNIHIYIFIHSFINLVSENVPTFYDAYQ